METSEALRNRIRAAEEISNVFKTMKGLAAVHMRQHQRVVKALESYHETIDLGLQVALRGAPPEMTQRGRTEHPGRTIGVVFGSDQGFCGPLNRELVARAHDWQRRHGTRESDLAAVGARIVDDLEEEGHALLDAFPSPTAPGGIGRCVEDMLLAVEAWRAEESVARVHLIHARPGSDCSFRLVEVQLLPLDSKLFRALSRKEWPTNQLPLLVDERRRLFSSLVRQHLFVSLYRAFAESLASENAARLAAMRTAEENIEERLSELRQTYHVHRQDGITSELLDVTAGYEALRGKSDRRIAAERDRKIG